MIADKLIENRQANDKKGEISKTITDKMYNNREQLSKKKEVALVKPAVVESKQKAPATKPVAETLSKETLKKVESDVELKILDKLNIN